STGMIELFVASLSDRGVTTEVPLVEWPDVVVFVGDEAVHRHHVVHDYRAHRFPRVSLRIRSRSCRPGGDWSCKKSISGHRTAVGGEPLLGGEAATQGQELRRG